jgi:hypothetical protein
MKEGCILFPIRGKISKKFMTSTITLLLKIKKGDEIKKIFISETTGTIGTKFCLDSP